MAVLSAFRARLPTPLRLNNHISPLYYSTMATTVEEDPSSRTQQSPLARQRAKEQGQDTSKIDWFPLGYKEGFSQWWQGLTPAVTEHRVLSFIPYLQSVPTQMQTGLTTGVETPDTGNGSEESEGEFVDAKPVTSTSTNDPYGPRIWKSELVKLSGKNRALNEFSIERVGEKTEHNLVMLHGYGAGLGFFYRNFEPLSRRRGWKLYSLDLLGMGRSSRPAFRIAATDADSKVGEAEAWFVDALEEWRAARGLDTFSLLGHSLGGYLAVAYALKYPGHLDKLILASPVGVPEDPHAVAAAMPDDASAAPPSERAAASAAAPPRRRPRWLTYLWEANISPFSVVRWAGPLGPRLVSGWTTRRFSHLPADEFRALHDYSYSLFRQKGSGEFALAYILTPGVFARRPLVRRIGGVGRQTLLTEGGSEKERGVPVVFLYGDHDWMDVKGGFDAKEKVDEETRAAIEGLSLQEQAKDNGSARVVLIENAGHHLYLDNPDEFNRIIEEEMEGVERRSRRMARDKMKV